MKETGEPYYERYSGLGQDKDICKSNTAAAMAFGLHLAG